VTLLVSGWNGGSARDHLDRMDIHRVGGRHSYLLGARRYFRSALRERGFDLIIEDLNKVPLFSPYWASAPLVLLVHHLFGATAFQEASLPIAAATWVLERPVPRVYRRAPVQAVSESTADDLVRRGFRRDQITVIPNGVDLEFYCPDPRETRFAEPTILYLGRVKKYKRIDLVVRAVAMLRAQGLGAKLIVAGKGNAADSVRRLAAELGIAEALSMPGYVDENEKRSLFRRSWVHVLTSSKEGWGISNLEAAACGTPTVASDSPGLRDSVVHGTTGFLVPHGNVAGLAAHLRLILEDTALRERLSVGAHRFALEFSWDRAAQRTEAHLRSVLDRRAGKGTGASGGSHRSAPAADSAL
jgi:glycosyltransferase involved in cell wall biosynthesis